MAAATQFDINVAVLGHSSAGKKTLIDALTRHGQCSKAQAILNSGEIACYSIVPGRESADKENGGTTYGAEASGAAKTVTLGDSVEFIERSFVVGTEESIVPLRTDTALSFTVVPPFDQNKSELYVTNKWASWDAVIVVIDGAKGISDEDSKLLKCIKKQNDLDSKPSIVVCNKIDDNESERLGKHVKKATAKVKKIFGEDGELNEPGGGIVDNRRASGRKAQIRFRFAGRFEPLVAGDVFQIGVAELVLQTG